MSNLTTHIGRPNDKWHFARIAGALRGLWSAYQHEHREASAAAELMTFSDRALADIGIGRCEIAGKVRFPVNHQAQADV